MIACASIALRTSYFVRQTAIIFCGFTLFACGSGNESSSKSTTTKNVDTDTSIKMVHPEWSAQSNIYEVNVRQFSPEGSFSAVTAALPRLQKMGVQILWFMPVTPIGIEGRKMKATDLGSYYAVRNYQALNEEFGTAADWSLLVKTAHQLGMKVIVDWVANHTAPDHPWTKSNPEFYMRDSVGTILPPNADWTDTRELNYDNREMRDSMIAAMNWWLKTFDIDGFRCDIAEEVPVDFWAQAIPVLRKEKEIFMLAEGEQPALHEAGFNATYTWSVFHLMNEVAGGKKTIADLKKKLEENQASFPAHAYRMYFTSNHDENSWNGTEFERMGAGAQTFAVLTQVLGNSIPLIYSGQESAQKKRLLFFERDPIQWGDYTYAAFYEKLLNLRKNNPALAATAPMKFHDSGHPMVLILERMQGDHSVITVLNMSNQAVSIQSDKTVLTKVESEKYQALFEQKWAKGKDTWTIPAWGFEVFSR